MNADDKGHGFFGKVALGFESQGQPQGSDVKTVGCYRSLWKPMRILLLQNIQTRSPVLQAVSAFVQLDLRMRNKHPKAMTLFELAIVVAAIGTLFALGIPLYTNQVNKARITKAIADIHTISQDIHAYQLDYEEPPESLAEIGRDIVTDPWGSPYEYLKIEGKEKKQVKSQWRKDRFLVPLNSDFDLYSKGEDKKSHPSLTAKDCRDDIVRANNGSYIGLASAY